MDTNTIIEGTVKFRDGKKWKSRWCVVRKLSPVADCIHLQLYRDSKERYKKGQTKASLSLENFLGIQSGFTLDKESNTLAIICQEVIVVLAFDTREHLMQWQVKISANLGEGDQFLVQISTAPTRAKLSAGPAKLLIQEYQFCLTVGVPPRLIAFWHIRQLRRFGVVEGKFCFEGGSRCGQGEGLFVLVSERPEDLARAFHLAAEGKLFTRKRPVTRNMSVMDKSRKHHTLRPESRLSDVSSLNSTIIDSEQGTKTACCSCSHSREDLLSWSHNPLSDIADTMSSSESNRFDLKSLWSSDVVMGRCTSCMSKIGNMSRSSTLTPCSRFPAWTMDRPKSCGAQKMSPSVTCSSVSLSSHSSCGSSCANNEPPHRHSTIDSSDLVCSINGTTCPEGQSLTPPSRPPKPAHLSILHLQLAPTLQSSSPLPSCCCNSLASPLISPYGNYDIPKPLNITQRKLNMDLKRSPVKLHPQSSVNDYYDTPRKLKDSLLWEYGNYDIPPPAQPVTSETTNNNQDKTTAREKRECDAAKSQCDSNTNNIISNMAESNQSQDHEFFHINKVKLTGEGRMPVMGPCGKIIENSEPTYEEKLEKLLENASVNSDTDHPSCSYANLDRSVNNNQDVSSISMNNVINTCFVSPNQNYSNIGLVQSLENYENFKCYFSNQSRVSNAVPQVGSELGNTEVSSTENKKCNITIDNNEAYCCSLCGQMCTSKDKISPFDFTQPHKNITSSLKLRTGNTQAVIHHQCVLENKPTADKVVSKTILGNKCNSTSCLHDINHDPISSQEKNSLNKRNLETKILSKCSVSAANSPALKRITRHYSVEQTINSKFQHFCLRKRSNSVDSTRIHVDDESVNDTLSTDSRGRTCVLSNSSSSDSLCVVQKMESVNENEIKKEVSSVHTCNLKLPPLLISENGEPIQVSLSNQKVTEKYSEALGTKRSSSVPNKFFSNRDSSSSNDSGVSTGSLSLRHYGTDFLEFEMPLTTSMSSKRHHIAMINSIHISNDGDDKQKMLPKRSKSVDPLRDLTFTFESVDQHTGKSTSAEAEVPLFLLQHRNKGYLSPPRTTILPDSRSTSSGTSDMSDYIETLSYSSFSSLDNPDILRYGRPSAPTMKPRSGKEYQKIDRYLLEEETK